MTHPLITALDTLERSLSEANVDVGTGVSALSNTDIQHVAQRAWSLLQQIHGAVMLPVIAEAAERRLFRREEYSSASSMRDLITGWLRCHPAVAGRLLETAKHCITGRFQATGAALAAGDIDLDHARAVIHSVRRLPAGVMTEPDHRQAETTMLTTARAADAEVTKAAGTHLLEVIAPDAAQHHADRQAERDRVRAEESRWFEVTGIGIAGCKELRLRAESSVIDGFVRTMTALVQPSVIDATATEQTAEEWVGRPGDPPTAASGTIGVSDGVTNGAVNDASGVPHPLSIDEDDAFHNGEPVGADTGQYATAPRIGVARAGEGPAVPAQTPGLVADGGLNLTPIERRRADAAVEVIDAITGPDILDDLTSAQLRRLANHLDAYADQTNDGANTTNSGSDAGIANDGDTAEDTTETDIALAVVDAGQVATDSCDSDLDGTSAIPTETTTLVPNQRPQPRTPVLATATGRAPGPQSKQPRSEHAPAPSTVATAGAAARTDPGADTYGARYRVDAARTGTGGPRVDRPSPSQPRTGRPSVGRDARSGLTADLRRDARVQGERPSLVIIANYDQQTRRPHAGETSSTGSPPRLASATEIERLACEALVTPVWMASDATPVAVAAPARFFRGKQLAALIARDRGCAFPGCSRGLRYTHAHHIRPWSEGGPTTVDNGVLLCSHHHRVVHRAGGWLIRMGTDRLPEFIPPSWIDPRQQPQRHSRHQTRLPAAA